MLKSPPPKINDQSRGIILPVPEPKPGESKEDFIPRCSSTLSHQDPNKPHDQIVAICHTTWRDARESSARLILPAAAYLLDAATHEATFYIMNTSKNRNRWSVTEKAMVEGAPTIKGKPIGCGKGYKIDDHYPPGENMDVGKFISYEIPSSYLTAKAKIEDDTVWGYLESQEWGPISVVIFPYEANCSSCGEPVLKDLSGGIFRHDHIIDGKAHAKIESFKFDRIDFVENPAYPQAGILDMDASAEDLSQAITLVASYYSNGEAPGSLNPEELRRKKTVTDKTPEELQKELEEKVNAIAELTEENERLKAAAKPDDDKDPEAEKIKERLAALEAQNTQQLIDACAEARFTAGLVKDLEAEKERIKDYPAAMLITLTADAGVVEEKLKARSKRAPKLKYDEEGEEITELEAAFKTVRDRLIPEHNHKMLMAQVGVLME